MNDMEAYIESRGEIYTNLRMKTTHAPDCTIVEVMATVGYTDYTAIGSSKRDPIDDYDPEIGVELAMGRAIRQLGREILKNANAGIREADQARLKRAEGQRKSLVQKAARRMEAKESRSFTSI